MHAEKGALGLGDFSSNEAYEYSYNTELLMEAGLIYGDKSKTLGKQASNFMAIKLKGN